LRKINNGFEIVAGERRWRAAKNLNLKVIPAVVKELSDKDVSEIALIENLQREDLNDIEEALAYKVLLDEYFITHEKLSKLVGKSRSYISNTIRLLKLDEKTTKCVEEGKISGGHGRALLPIEKIEDRHKIVDEIIEKNLSVREVERMVSNFNKPVSKRTSLIKDENLLAVEEKLSEHLGTKASIKLGKSKNKIEIEYYSANDLNRILEVLKI
jgi:ParB family chromosome partitioning protein